MSYGHFSRMTHLDPYGYPHQSSIYPTPPPNYDRFQLERDAAIGAFRAPDPPSYYPYYERPPSRSENIVSTYAARSREPIWSSSQTQSQRPIVSRYQEEEPDSRLTSSQQVPPVSRLTTQSYLDTRADRGVTQSAMASMPKSEFSDPNDRPFPKPTGYQSPALQTSSRMGNYGSTMSYTTDNTPMGLLNYENCCYLNSVLQVLARTFLFADFISEKGNLKIMETTSAPMLQEFSNVLSLLKEKPPREQYTDARLLKRYIEDRFPSFRGAYHQDAQELLRALLDFLHETLKAGKSKEGVTQSSVNEESDEWWVSYRRWTERKKAMNSGIVDNVFGGHFLTWVKCGECKAGLFKFEEFLEMTLSFQIEGKFYSGILPSSFKDTTLEQMLRDEFEAEKLDGYLCDKCKRRSSAVLKKYVLKAPPVLVLTIKRFDQDLSKVNNPVKFPLKGLSLDPLIIEKTEQFPAYDLYGVIYHAGTLSSGHYTAQVKMDDGRWYDFNDAKVSEINEPKTTSSDAYILFYKSQDPYRLI